MLHSLVNMYISFAAHANNSDITCSLFTLACANYFDLGKMASFVFTFCRLTFWQSGANFKTRFQWRKCDVNSETNIFNQLQFGCLSNHFCASIPNHRRCKHETYRGRTWISITLLVFHLLYRFSFARLVDSERRAATANGGKQRRSDSLIEWKPCINWQQHQSNRIQCDSFVNKLSDPKENVPATQTATSNWLLLCLRQSTK